MLTRFAYDAHRLARIIQCGVQALISMSECVYEWGATSQPPQPQDAGTPVRTLGVPAHPPKCFPPPMDYTSSHNAMTPLQPSRMAHPSPAPYRATTASPLLLSQPISHLLVEILDCGIKESRPNDIKNHFTLRVVLITPPHAKRQNYLRHPPEFRRRPRIPRNRRRVPLGRSIPGTCTTVARRGPRRGFSN